MTNREFFNAIVNANLSDEITAHAKAALEKLDNTLAARKNKPSKTQLANAPLIEAVKSLLTTEPQPASAFVEPAAAVVDEELATKGRIVRILSDLVKAGFATSTPAHGKTPTTYALAETVEG